MAAVALSHGKTQKLRGRTELNACSPVDQGSDLFSESYVPERAKALGWVNEQAPVHPGEVLREEYPVPRGITSYELAESMRILHHSFVDILKMRKSIEDVDVLIDGSAKAILESRDVL